MTALSSLRPLRRFAGSAAVDVDDAVAVEAPLEIQVFDGQRFRPLAVVMRSPSSTADGAEDDEDHVVGFLVSEGVVGGVDDIADIDECDVVPDADALGNVWRVRLRAGLAVDWARLQRNTYVSSSCGVCGKASIENACAVAGPLTSNVEVTASSLRALAQALRAQQPTFARTGGLHGALLATSSGEVLAVREDVGRHNAVDKVIGAALRAGRRGDVLLVSGRVSFELVQKALAARIAIVAGVSAPTSLAVDLGAKAGVCVVGFVRGDVDGGGCNVYSHLARVRP